MVFLIKARQTRLTPKEAKDTAYCSEAYAVSDAFVKFLFNSNVV